MVVLAPPPAGGQAGAEVTAVGWWSRRPGASPQPAGGFEVARGLGGPESVAAVRVSLSGPVERAVLVLGERDGLLHEQATVRVCPAADGWSPANPGPFDQAPAADCARQVVLARNVAQANWTADVTALLPSGGSASLAVVPGPGGGAVDPGFQVRFASASLLVEVAPTAGGDGGEGGGVAREPFGSGQQAAGGGGPGPTTFGATGPGSTGLGDIGPLPAPPAGDLPAGPAPVGADAAATTAGTVRSGPGVPGADAAAGTFSPRFARDGGGGPGRPWGRLAAVIPVSAALGLAAAVGRRRLAGRWRVGTG
jgi:hypothetical protein